MHICTCTRINPDKRREIACPTRKRIRPGLRPRALHGRGPQGTRCPPHLQQKAASAHSKGASSSACGFFFRAVRCWGACPRARVVRCWGACPQRTLSAPCLNLPGLLPACAPPHRPRHPLSDATFPVRTPLTSPFCYQWPQQPSTCQFSPPTLGGPHGRLPQQPSTIAPQILGSCWAPAQPRALQGHLLHPYGPQPPQHVSSKLCLPLTSCPPPTGTDAPFGLRGGLQGCSSCMACTPVLAPQFCRSSKGARQAPH